MQQQQAKIVSISGHTIECIIECGDACKGCAARKACGADSEQNRKILTLLSNNPNHKVGDIITVEISTAMGLRAVLLAYLLPVAITIAVLLILQSLDINELSSGISAIVTLALYFVALKVFSIGSSLSISIVEEPHE